MNLQFNTLRINRLLQIRPHRLRLLISQQRRDGIPDLLVPVRFRTHKLEPIREALQAGLRPECASLHCSNKASVQVGHSYYTVFIAWLLNVQA